MPFTTGLENNLKIIHKAKVYVLCRPQFDGVSLNHFLTDEGRETQPVYLAKGAERLIENAGRVCYMSYGKGRKTNEEFLRNLINSGHHSVLEHTNWSILITGISRSLSHEFVRHRHFSYSQLSQRYVDSKDVAFILPPALEGVAKAIWEASCAASLEAYNRIIMAIDGDDFWEGSPTQKRKQVRQIARSVLPNCTETKMVVTGNARAWREFFDKRGTIHAEPEIRRLAVLILAALKNEAPVLFEDYSGNNGIIECGQ